MFQLNKFFKINKIAIHNKYIQSFSQFSWSTVDPETISKSNPAIGHNLVNGQWKSTQEKFDIVDPLNGDVFMRVPNTNSDADLLEFKQSAESCKKYGLHNPLRNVERYNMYGDILFKLAAEMRKPEVEEYFIKLISRVFPKSYAQAKGEVVVTRKFLENFSGDNVRFIMQGFHVSGDHDGQQTNGYRWPFGPVMIISPFNFPIEIPVLQMFGALMTGNRLTLKPDPRVAFVMEQFTRLAIDQGMPATDMDLLYADGKATEKLLLMTKFRNLQFTGSSTVGERLSLLTRGKCRLEDAGFDWKILGPDVDEIDFVAYTCDQDAYALAGQKCSAQSMLFVHQNWNGVGIKDKIKAQAAKRNFEDLSIAPVMSWNNEQIKEHIANVLKIEGSELLFGGKELKNHKVPKQYGLFEPTAIYVPLEQIAKEENFDVVCKELFGPFQIITDYDDSQIDIVLNILERQNAHLTAGIVSNDRIFVNNILGKSVNGTQYIGIRARTTGAPQNHWFGPCGDPRSSGIGTKEGILLTWTGHREIIYDSKVDKDWKMPIPN